MEYNISKIKETNTKFLIKSTLILIALILMVMAVISIINTFRLNSITESVGSMSTSVIIGLVFAILFAIYNIGLICYHMFSKNNISYMISIIQFAIILMLGIIAIVFYCLSTDLTTLVINEDAVELLMLPLVSEALFDILLSTLCLSIIPYVQFYKNKGCENKDIQSINISDNTQNNKEKDSIQGSTIYNEQQRKLEQELAEERQRYKVLQLQQEINAVKQQTDKLVNNTKENKD